MVNYILGVEWKDDFRFKLITENDKLLQVDWGMPARKILNVNRLKWAEKCIKNWLSMAKGTNDTMHLMGNLSVTWTAINILITNMSEHRKLDT